LLRRTNRRKRTPSGVGVPVEQAVRQHSVNVTLADGRLENPFELFIGKSRQLIRSLFEPSQLHRVLSRFDCMHNVIGTRNVRAKNHPRRVSLRFESFQ
jgi:hypothetical protein